MRGLLALGILIVHLTQNSILQYGGSKELFQGSWTAGRCIVVIFICVSGYWINESLKKQNDFSLWKFMVSRIYRIYPVLMFCALIAGTFELLMYGSPYRPTLAYSNIELIYFIRSFVGIGGYFGDLGSFAPAWVISCLMLYYFIWGVTKKLKLDFISTLALNEGLIILLLIGREYLPFPLSVFFGPYSLFYYFPWLIGAAISNYKEELPGVIRRIFEWRPATDRFSYSLYLIHLPVIIFTNYLFNVYGIKTHLAVNFLLSGSAAILASVIITYLIELPVERFRHQSIAEKSIVIS